jgi:hypothetical protein
VKEKEKPAGMPALRVVDSIRENSRFGRAGSYESHPVEEKTGAASIATTKNRPTAKVRAS